MKASALVFCVVVASLCFWSGSCDRTVRYDFNWGCPKYLNCSKQGTEHDDEFNNLLYWRASELNGSNVLHYLFSTIGYPALLQIRTTKDAEISIDWERLLNKSSSANSITVTNGETLGAFGLGLTALWRFNDDMDKANVDLPSPASSTEAISMAKLSWHSPVVTSAQLGADVATSYYDGQRNDTILASGGRILLTTDIFGKTGRGDKVPHMPHTDSMGQLSILLDRLNYNLSQLPRPRFALELVTVDSAADVSNVDFAETTSIDDEYTPGVFRTFNLHFPSGSFLAFKPVCYRDPDRTFTNYALITHNRLANETLQAAGEFSILSAYFGSQKVHSSRAFNVTLGYPKDKFYSSQNYTLWTLTFGSGSIPSETFSGLMIVLIIVCFGLPGLAILVGSAYMLLKRARGAQTQEQLLVNGAPVDQ